MAAYTGLLTGAGAAGGLETLLARMRAEEEQTLRQRAFESHLGQQSIENQFRNRQIGLNESMAPSLMYGRQAEAEADLARAGGERTKMNLLGGLSPSQQALAMFPGLRPHPQSQEDQYISGLEQEAGHPFSPEERLNAVGAFSEKKRGDLGWENLQVRQTLLPLQLKMYGSQLDAADQQKQLRNLRMRQMQSELERIPPELQGQFNEAVKAEIAKRKPWFSGIRENEEDLLNRELDATAHVLQAFRQKLAPTARPGIGAGNVTPAGAGAGRDLDAEIDRLFPPR